MFSKIEQLPIPDLVKLQMCSLSKQWELKPILTRANIKLTRIVTILREVQFHFYGFYGVCGFFLL